METNNLEKSGVSKENSILLSNIDNSRKKIYYKIIVLSVITVIVKFILPSIIIFLFPFPNTSGLEGFIIGLGYATIVGFVYLVASIIIVTLDIIFSIRFLRKKYTKLTLIPGILGVYLLLTITLPFLAPRITMFFLNPFQAISLNQKNNLSVEQYEQFARNVENKEFTVVDLRGGDSYVLKLDNGMQVYVYTGAYDGNKNILIREFFEKNITKEKKITLTPFTLKEYNNKISNEYIEVGTTEYPIFAVKSLNLGTLKVDFAFFNEIGTMDINRYAKLLTYIKDYYSIYGTYPESIPSSSFAMSYVYVPRGIPNEDIMYRNATSNYYGLSGFSKDSYKYKVSSSLDSFIFKLNSERNISESTTNYNFRADYFIGNKLGEVCNEKTFCFDEKSLLTFVDNDSTEYLIKRPTKTMIQLATQKLVNGLTIKEISNNFVKTKEGFLLKIPSYDNYKMYLTSFAEKCLLNKMIYLSSIPTVDTILKNYNNNILEAQLPDQIGIFGNNFEYYFSVDSFKFGSTDVNKSILIDSGRSNYVCPK